MQKSKPHTFHSVSAHRKTVLAILHGGSARGHRANPAATLRVEKVFCMSVLLSGLSSLILTCREEKLLDQQYKVHLQRLLKLHQATPAPVVYFLAGCLPIVAQIHLRIFSLFGQLCRLRCSHNILANHASSVFASASASSKSWFWNWRNMLQFKVKADTLVSLNYMRTGFMSLTKCHPLYTSCGSSPWEVEKAVTQSRLLSGR